ncbi:MAG TPA: hypothetical protein PLQ91_01465 [Bacteroidales bacterium]|jgi:hypothetical protein|nr:hypothetical protein [Bacteroidales bacterium]HPU46283.1 hypothetical protein [Bacteroidales bacterium]HXK90698.1 hypothetical protein [Bacteroidales bacterium]
MKRLFIMVIIAFLFASCVGVIEVQETKTKPSPPPHAPAHGVRTKYQYRYYPSLGIYYDINRGIYFYLESGIWKSSNALPSNITISLKDYVVLDLDTDKPYKYYNKHKKQYPSHSNNKNKKPKK